jgi:hypothetical protein
VSFEGEEWLVGTCGGPLSRSGGSWGYSNRCSVGWSVESCLPSAGLAARSPLFPSPFLLFFKCRGRRKWAGEGAGAGAGVGGTGRDRGREW